MLTNLAERYDDLKHVSKVHEVNAQVQDVKLTMQENIVAALANTESLQHITEKTGR